MGKKIKLYDEDSIKSLPPREFTRLRPSVYCGSTEYSTQLLIEIFSNALDEVRAGRGDTINVTIDGSTVTVEDNAQGFLVNTFNRDDGKSVLEAAFSVLNTSGKFNADGVYEGVSLGLYGIGAKLPIFLSPRSQVTSYKDGKFETVYFEDGVFKSRESGETNHPNGTVVSWTPDKQFFTHTEIDIGLVKQQFKIYSCLVPNLTINLNYNNDNYTYHSENGLEDLLNDEIKNKELLESRFKVSNEEDKYKLNLILSYTTDYGSKITGYVNGGLTDSGSHFTQLKSYLTKVLNKFFREKGWLKDKDDNLTGDDLQEGIYIIFDYTAPNVTYDAQVKSRVSGIDAAPMIKMINDVLPFWLEKNIKDIKLIADKAINARKAREAAKKARDAARNVNEKKAKKVLKFDSKLADASSKNRKECEIMVVEGDSASGNLKLARDNNTQAVLPVRGKIINCLKASLDKIQKNAEIMTMIEAFGLTVDSKTMKLTFDPEDLRYGKIIIMSDADVDGSHIKNLFYTFIWTFCPKLIEEGYVYAAQPPLYRVTESKDKYVYLKDDAALEKYKASHGGQKLQLMRLKGLGEMSADETKILVDPNERILHQVTVEDINAANKLFEDLMGEAVLPRKNFIKAHSQEATNQI